MGIITEPGTARLYHILAKSAMGECMKSRILYLGYNVVPLPYVIAI